MLNEINEGDYTYTREGSAWAITYKGEELPQRVSTVPDARRVAYEHSRTVPQTVTYTIVGGPGRAQQTRRHTN